MMTLKHFASSLLLSLLLLGCDTVSPDPVKDKQASFDGNAQNSGIVALRADHSALVTSNFVARYEFLVARHGSRLTPPQTHTAGLTTNGTAISIDAAHLVDFVVMQEWQKSGQ
jgi:hypothetical protein